MKNLSQIMALALIALATPAVAVLLFREAAPVEDPSLSHEQLWQIGLAAFQRGDFANAKRDFQRLADGGDVAAMTLLGTMAANGQGGPQQPAVAAAWFSRAAKRGYAPAQLALADSFQRGRGLVADPVQAWELAQQAAAQGQAGTEAIHPPAR